MEHKQLDEKEIFDLKVKSNTIKDLNELIDLVKKSNITLVNLTELSDNVDEFLKTSKKRIEMILNGNNG